MEESEPWSFTVVRTNGLRLMRPEKVWRPIITVEVDQHPCHETVFGVDGQNPNLKEKFHLQDARIDSKLDFRVWHRSQSKRKGKKKSLVASASHSLGELVKRQEKEPHAKLEIRLQCQTTTNKAISSRGKPQNGATLLLRIYPPAYIIRSLQDDSDVESTNEYLSDSGLSTKDSGTLITPASPIDDSWPNEETLTEGAPTEASTLRRRRRPVRPYAITSDDEIALDSDEEYYEQEEKLFMDKDAYYSREDEGQDPFFDDPKAVLPLPEGVISITSGEWQLETSTWSSPIFPSLLPQYTEKVEVPQELTLAERLLAMLTLYSELRAATLDSQYERILHRLRMEWTYIGGSLLTMATLSTAVFSMSPGSIFAVHLQARNTIAACSIASGLGIAVDAWFVLRYNWVDVHTFKSRSRDVYGSYLFFSLSSRVPAFCLFLSAFSLMLFLGLVAFDAWPIGVIVASFVIGLIMTLQFLVFGAHWCILKVADGMRRVVKFWTRLARRDVEENSEGRGKMGGAFSS